MKRLVLLIFFLFFLFSQKASAASITIQNTPSTINESDEFSVDVSLNCSGCSDSYLRGVFYESGTSYFGYTQDNIGSFSNAAGSNCTTFYKIAQSDLVSGSWSGKIKFKPDSGSSYYKGSGEYSFKVGRYTSSCTSPSVWSPEILISIIGPSSTPTNALSATPTVSSAKTSTPTPSPTIISSKITPKPTAKASVKSASIAVKKDATVAGQDNFYRLNITPTVTFGNKKEEIPALKNNPSFLITLSVGGILFIIAAGIFIKKYQSEIWEWINS